MDEILNKIIESEDQRRRMEAEIDRLRDELKKSEEKREKLEIENTLKNLLFCLLGIFVTVITCIISIYYSGGFK